ncbi:MAG: PAS domain S-box protein, partial [Bacteroidota bacterium]
MDKKISILHLEDMEADSLLVRVTLEKEFPSFVYHFVDDQEGFQEALNTQTFDVILSDYEIPGYSGEDALQYARNYYPSIPFIFVTGKMGEDTAIESLTHGATDYVLKSRLERLVPAIQRALHESALIKERENAIAAFIESEKMLTTISRQAPYLISITDTRGFITYASHASTKLFGISPQEMCGRNFTEFLDPSSIPLAMSTFQKTLETGRVGTHVELQMRRADGSLFHGELDGGRFKTEKEDGSLVIIHDISERQIGELSERARHASEKALYESEEKYRTLFNTMMEGVVVLDPTGQIINANPAAERILGLKQSEILGKLFDSPEWIVFRPNMTPMPAEEMAGPRAMKEKRPVKNVLMGIQRPDNLFAWINVNAAPVLDDAGNIKMVVGTFSDITERKQMDDSLTVEKNLMDTLMMNIPDHLYFKDLESRFIRISESNNESFRIRNSSEAIGKTDFDFFSEEHARAAYEDEQEIIRSGKPMIKEEKETWADRPDTWAHSTKLPLRDQEGKIIGTFGISRDITRRKKAEDELLVAKEKAEASNRLKTAFIRNISHEIHTPLNGILGFGQILAESDPSPKEKEEMLTLVNASSDRLINTVSNIMDISLIVSGNQKVKNKIFDPSMLLDEIHQKFNHDALLKDLTIEVIKDESINGLTMDSDPELLKKILNHLVGNAIKFTNKGGIQVGCEVSQNEVLFGVKDTGVGIHPDKLADIFDHFFQEDIATTRGFEGNGLGLSI